MALARALADAGEDRDALIALHHRVDQLHHHDGLADAGAAEHRRLAALRERREQVDDLDAGFEDGGRRAALAERRRCAMDRRARQVAGSAGPLSRTLPGDVEQATEHRDRRPAR